MHEMASAGAFDQQLKVGMIVAARWTWSHSAYSCKAEVVKINNKSIKVKLLGEIEYYGCGKLPVGHVVTLPRFGNRLFSNNNGVFAND